MPQNITRITFMLANEDARCDAMLTAERTYYRFMTEDSLEDGDLPGLGERFETEAEALLDCFRASPEISSSIEPLRFQLFVNNVAVKPVTLNRSTLRAFTRHLAELYQEFSAWTV